MEIQDDIVRTILKANEDLKPGYYYYLDTFTNSYVETANFSKRLSSLSCSIASSLSDNTLMPQALIDILDAIEGYAVLLEDTDLKHQLEIMFFEGILNIMSHFEENEECYRYVGLFRDNVGPASEELCKKNHAFWLEVIHNKNENIRKHYADLEKERSSITLSKL